MDKDAFYKKFHQELSDRHGLDVHQVATIRGFLHERDRKQIAEWCALKIHNHKKWQRRPLSHYQGILNFVASCSEEAWKDMTQKTEYDG